MNVSKVYFTDMRCKVGVGLLSKMDKLILQAGIGQIDFKQKYVAIKIHFGEPGNLSFLRPNFAKTLADHVKALGGKPFLTDCNTLYVGRRNNALLHLDAAFENGYFPLSTGCQNIIADGLKGTDDVEVPIEGGIYCKTALIGRAVMDADILVSLSHFKGHESTGFGGAIKNVGMGCGSRAGKMNMHSAGKPVVNPEVCVGCRVCSKYCAQSAISFIDNSSSNISSTNISSTNGSKASIDHGACVGCGRCIGACNADAISLATWSDNKILNCRIAEYCKAVLSGRPHFHVSVVNQVSPYCDCHEENDAAVVPDIGIFASHDPVALDKACINAVNAAPGIPTSILSEREHTHGDHFTDIHPRTDWRVQISHAEKIGLGTGNYELITVN